MSLRFGLSTQDRVEVADKPSISNLTAFTVLIWFHLLNGDVAQEDQKLFSKAGNPNGEAKGLMLGTNGKFYASVDRATEDSSCITAPNLFNKRIWNFIAFSFNTAQGVKVYLGTEKQTPKLIPNTTGYTGSGALKNDNESPIFFGNDDDFVIPFRGLLGPVAYVNRALRSDEIRQQHQNMHKITGMKVLLFLGRNGIREKQFDQSGNANHGTMQGSSANLLKRASPRYSMVVPQEL